MANIRFPRSGSMQFWPRVIAKREYARLRTPTTQKDAKPATFPGYKVGMTHIMITDGRKNSPTKGSELSWPVTVIECPPVKVMAIRFYKNAYEGKEVIADVYADKHEKDLSRKLVVQKKHKSMPAEFDDVKILVHTKPAETGIGKKKPEVFEISLGGKKEDKLAFAKEHLGKEMKIQDVFKEGNQVDIHGVTKGKGYQGPIKRFGIGIRQHKSEKTKRGPGSLGGWVGQGHVMYRVAHAGKMGYHQRTELNKQILKVSDKPEEINVKGGYKNYGEVKSTYILVKGSTIGPSNRMIILTASKRPTRNVPADAPTIETISLDSKQGR